MSVEVVRLRAFLQVRLIWITASFPPPLLLVSVLTWLRVFPFRV